MITDSRLATDITRIKASLGNGLDKVGIFGSCLTSFEQANDIDIALFVDDVEIESVYRILSDLDLNYELDRGRISFKYSGGGGSPKSVKSAVKKFDIVLLDARRPDKEFLRRNPKMVYV